MDKALKEARELAGHAHQQPRQQPEVIPFFDEATNTASYVVADPSSPRCAVIDSVLDFDNASGRTSTHSADRIVDFIAGTKRDVSWQLQTHAHADHLSAAPYLKERTGGCLAIGRGILAVQSQFGELFNFGGPEHNGREFDKLFEDGDSFVIGKLNCRVLHVPGHTPADVAYVIGDAVFVGDTLFMPDSGTARADFPGGDAARSAACSICRQKQVSSSATTTKHPDATTSPGRQRSQSSERATFTSATASTRLSSSPCAPHATRRSLCAS